MAGDFQKLRKRVDRDLTNNNRPWSIFIPFLAGIFTALILGSNSDERIWAIAIIQLMLSPWYLFIGWRGYRLMKAASLLSARQYEQKWRHKLPPEYSDSESAATAKWRRRRKR